MGCIYLITNLINGKGYVGQSRHDDPIKRYNEHWATLTKSRCILHNAMMSYGKDYFKVELLSIVENDGLDNMEAYWAEQLGTYMWDIPGGYNMVWCGEGCRRGILHSDDTKRLQSKLAIQRGNIVGPKISSILSGRKMSPDHLEKHKERMNSQSVREKISKAHKGKVITQEQRDKISESSKLFWTEEKRLEVSKQRKAVGRKMSAESKAILSESKKGHVVSDETKEKLRLSNLGKKVSDETKEKLRLSNLGKRVGIKMTDDAKAKMSLARRGKPATDAQIIANINAKIRRFCELFDKHYADWIDDPSKNKQWRYDMSRKRRDGRLSEEHIKKLESTPGWTWSS